MSQNNFVIRPNLRYALGRIAASLVFAAVTVWAFIFLLVIGAGSVGELIFGIFVILFCPVMIMAMLSSAIWKLTIQEDNICFWSLFGRARFTFDDIERVELDIINSRTGTLKMWHVFLKGRSERRPIKVPHESSGIDTFLDCLESKNISGAKRL